MSESPLPFKPTKQQLTDAAGKTVPDVIGPGLRVLFCGINPGLYTAAVGHHFARPGNRFWPALHQSGFTDRLLSPFEERELLKDGLGITNVVAHATVSAAELTKEDFIAGGRALVAKVRRYRPRIVAVLGVGAYRDAFAKPKAVIGEQDEGMAGARVWVLPNPSGLNANYQLEHLAGLFGELRRVADTRAGGTIVLGRTQETIGRRGRIVMIRKLKSGQYRLYSRKKDPKTGKRRNLGTFETRAAAEKHERAVQYFKKR